MNAAADHQVSPGPWRTKFGEIGSGYDARRWYAWLVPTPFAAGLIYVGLVPGATEAAQIALWPAIAMVAASAGMFLIDGIISIAVSFRANRVTAGASVVVPVAWGLWGLHCWFLAVQHGVVPEGGSVFVATTDLMTGAYSYSGGDAPGGVVWFQVLILVHRLLAFLVGALTVAIVVSSAWRRRTGREPTAQAVDSDPVLN